MNDAQWTSALEECYARVLRALIGACGSQHAAEDGLQDAMVAAWKPGVRSEIQRPDAWLCRAGLRAVRRGWWRRRREVRVDTERAAAAPPTLDRVFALELLKKLSTRQRELVLARFFLDMSYAEIAAHWDITVGTAASTVSQALAKLRNDLQKEEAGWTSRTV
jgi:RNA polymerase sigma factor (sigma-70 family)